MATTIRMTRRGVEEILKSNKVRAMLTEHAQNVLSAAQADPHDDSGDYELSLRIDQDTTDRAAVRVVAGVDYSHAVEAKYGVLARALDHA